MPNTAICSVCGSSVKLPEGRGAGFCAACGAPVTATASAEGAQPSAYEGANAPRQPYAQQPHTPAAPQTSAPTFARETPPTTGSRVPRLFIGIGATVIVVVTAVVFVASAFAGNSYQKAELNFIKALTSAGPAAAVKDGGVVDFTAEYSPAGWMDDYLDISDMSLAGSLAWAGQELAANLTLTSGGEKVSDIVYAYDGSEMTLALPDLTDYYLRLLSGEADSGAGFDFSELDQKKLEATMTEIAKTYFDVANDISEVEKGVELTGGGLTVKCDKYTMNFTEDAVARIVLTAIAELRKNDNLLAFIASAAALQYGGYYDADDILEEIEDALDEAEDYFSDLDGDSRLFRMVVWTSGGRVAARKIDRLENLSGAVLSYKNMAVKKDSFIEIDGSLDYYGSMSLTATKKASEFEIEADINAGGVSMSLEGDFEKAGGAWSGSAELNVTDYYSSYTVVSSKIKCSDLKFSGGRLQSGAVSVKGTVDDDAAFDFDLTLGGSGGKRTIAVEGEIADYGERYDMGEFTLTYSTEKKGKPSIPKYNESLAVDLNDYSSDENADRAYDMAEQLRDELYDDAYDDNEFVGELLYELWRAVDDIGYYSEYFG
ncbi:MAG: hypothetical protein LBD92_03500 [Oscillospiraceae bacterium]|jgi:hypothetical protein|nr:hypothetical protein [Oscillospiraceae bacterium]